MAMNRYGRAALVYWRQSLPRRYRVLPDPTAFFTHLGEAERQAGELWDELVLASPPADGETAEQRSHRLARLKEEAERAVLDELVRPPRDPSPPVTRAPDSPAPAGRA
jgi:hypothetical protein